MKLIKIYNILNSLQDGEIIFLKADGDFMLLTGVILSAQTTDNQVNKVLPELFRRFPGPAELAAAPKNAVVDIIRSTGFYNNKADNIIAAAGMICRDFGGRVPENMDDLLKLPGVGRKTANVILGACFGKPAVIVDTHFSRTVQRLDLTPEKRPDRIEADIAAKTPDEIQYRFSMLMNKFGRDYCKASRPLCSSCPVADLCNWELKDRFLSS